MKHKSTRSWPLTLLVAVAACSGPITTRSGIEGPPVTAAAAPALAITLAPLPEGSGPAAIAARKAVADALGRQGYRLAEDAPLRMDVAIAERPAQVDLRPLAGAALSPAKTQRLLQNCHDRTHRLTLAVTDPAHAGVTRAWAEEHHCKGTLADSLPALARQAVGALAPGTSERSTERAGKD